MLVYKYMPTDRFFTNYKFRLTPAEDLNDPRELIPDIRLRDPEAYASDIVIRNLESTYWRMQIANPNLAPSAVWTRLLAAAHAHIQGFDAKAKASEIFDMFMRVANRNVGVLSLTDNPFNELMWAHYANSHAGFVVGLDSESNFFRPKPGEPKVCGDLMNVVYTDTTPVVYVDAGKLDIPKEIFFTKTIRWSYEQEWRMIKYLPMADEVIQSNGKPIHLFSVPEEAVKEVYFGTKVDSTVADELEANILKNVPHVSIKRLRFAPGVGLRAV